MAELKEVGIHLDLVVAVVDAESLDKIIKIDIVRKQLEHVDIVLLNKYAHRLLLFHHLELSASRKNLDMLFFVFHMLLLSVEELSPIMLLCLCI